MTEKEVRELIQATAEYLVKKLGAEMMNPELHCLLIPPEGELPAYYGVSISLSRRLHNYDNQVVSVSEDIKIHPNPPKPIEVTSYG